MQEQNFEKRAKFYRALAEPIRLRILWCLLSKDEKLCVCDLAKFVGRDQSVVFRHVQILNEEGIIDTEKEGNCLFCFVKGRKKVRGFFD